MNNKDVSTLTYLVVCFGFWQWWGLFVGLVIFTVLEMINKS